MSENFKAECRLWSRVKTLEQSVDLEEQSADFGAECNLEAECHFGAEYDFGAREWTMEKIEHLESLLKDLGM